MTTAHRSWLVTGGAGFIGSHLATRLVEMGRPVRVVDNLSTGSRANVAHIAGQIEFIEGNLCDERTCAQAVESVDVVFHVAALPSVPRSLADPWGSHDSNVNATVRLLQAAHAAGVRRIVFSSSSSIYGDTPTLPKVESAELLPRSPYAASKLAAEQYVLAYARARLVEGVALRYFNVFGPRQNPDSQYAAVIPLFFRAAISGTPATIFGDGGQTRDFTYIGNVVDANLLAATAPTERASGYAINVGAGERTSINELLDLMEQITDCPITRHHRPPRPGDVRDSLAALQRAADRLGYRPEVRLRDGLQRTWEWFDTRRSALKGGSA
jgi:nucleoside-diphosphate-sugar epimerase